MVPAAVIQEAVGQETAVVLLLATAGAALMATLGAVPLPAGSGRQRLVGLAEASAAGFMLGVSYLLLTVGLVYANICIFAKRFHDAGTSGWWIIAVWFAKFFTFIIMFALFGGLFLGSDGTALLEAVMEGWATDDEAQLTQASRRLVDLLFPLIILSYVVNGVLAALVVGSLPSDPAANIHGRPPGDGPETFN